ncbi:MAG: T9SS type A sorting domain-containing protein [Saprospiraceae bacterium]|nr:T9SS type A sorting domain-containing protein [Saprospiraceae bacterium]
MALRILYFLFFAFVLSFHLNAQVEGVNYQIKFNKSTCLFDCCIIIMEGSATLPIHRAQFNAQYSVVVPTGSTVFIAQNHMPVQNNQNYNGTVPMNWYLSSSIVAPAAAPESDFYSITPTLTPTSFYNNVSAGDTIRLFSLSISPVKECTEGVRLFENGVDPDSQAPGMFGGDFSNGFTMGGYDQKYFGNTAELTPEKPTIHQLNTNCELGLNVSLNATAYNCQPSLQYYWSGPQGFQSTSQNISIPSAGIFNNGTYHVTVTDNIGCKTIANIQAFAKPSAGPDQNIQCYLSGSATIASEGQGNWYIGAGSAGSATLSNPQNTICIVSAFTSPGNYFLVREANNCRDTMVINTGTQCSCQVVNALTIPPGNEYCGQSGILQLNGNNVSEQGNYLWQYKLDNQSFVNASGTNNGINYQSQNLSVGQHYFRRIFNKTSQPTCSDTSNFILITVKSTPNAGPDKIANCMELDTLDLNASGMGFWSLGQGSAGTLEIMDFANPSTKIYGFSHPGLYYLLWSNGICADTSIVTVNQLCGCDEAVAGLNRETCAGSEIQLSGSCILGSWSQPPTNPMGAVIQEIGNGVANVSFNKMSTGNYHFIFTIDSLLADTLLVVVRPLPVINAGEDFDYCTGSQPVTIVASGGATYLWSTGHTGNSITVSPTQNTDYIVTGTSIYGCSSSDTIRVMVRPGPSGSVPAMPPYYEEETMQLNSGSWTNALTYHWTGPNGFESFLQNPVIQNLNMSNAGTYHLTVTSQFDCTATAFVKVEVLERPLPITLLYFYGKRNEELQQNELTWITSREFNNDYFVIERSSDALSFSEIREMKGAGSTNRINTYQFIDKESTTAGNYYYRIKQIDFDGKYSFTDMILIEVKLSKDFIFKLFPNPSVSFVHLLSENDWIENTQLEILNSQGLKVYDKNMDLVIANKNLLSDFDIKDLPTGLYFIKITSKNHSQMLRWMVMK